MSQNQLSYDARVLMISILTSGIYQRTGTIDPLVLSGQIKRVLEEANKTGRVDAPKPSKTPDPDLFKGIEKTRDGYAKKTPSTKVAYIIHAKGPVDRRIFIQIHTANCMLLQNGEMVFGGACSLKELENVLNTSLGNIDAEAVAFVGSPRNWEAHHYYIKEHWAAFFVTQHPQASPTVQAAVKKLMGYLDWITPEFWDKVSAPEVEQPSVEALAHTTPEPTPEFAVGYVIHAKGFVHSRTFATINVSSCTLLPGDDMVLTGVCSLQALQRYLEIDLIGIDYEAATFTEGLKTWNPEFYYTKTIGGVEVSSYVVYRPNMSQQAWDAVKRLSKYLIGIPEDYENSQPLIQGEQPSVEALTADPVLQKKVFGLGKAPTPSVNKEDPTRLVNVVLAVYGAQLYPNEWPQVYAALKSNWLLVPKLNEFLTWSVFTPEEALSSAVLIRKCTLDEAHAFLQEVPPGPIAWVKVFEMDGEPGDTLVDMRRTGSSSEEQPIAKEVYDVIRGVFWERWLMP